MINVVIVGTSTFQTLSLIDPNTGVDWVKDLIGNFNGFNDGQFVWDESQGAYLATQETYDWWTKVLSDHSALTERIAEVKNLTNKVEEVDQIVWAASDCDLEDQATRVNAALDEAYGVSIGR
ncbi:hypothetical protein [Paenibacillus amylolyticus]|uniref:Uncharacterized protein n=1 Tax=Paenibacillus amylolyticus TaxID=1451 RepID=A0ABD8B3Y6_PAEAM